MRRFPPRSTLFPNRALFRFSTSRRGGNEGVTAGVKGTLVVEYAVLPDEQEVGAAVPDRRACIDHRSALHLSLITIKSHLHPSVHNHRAAPADRPSCPSEQL